MKKKNKEKKTKEKEKKSFADSYSEKVENFEKKEEILERNYKYKTNRVMAYLVDLLIVATLVTLLICNTITNPYYGSIKESYNTYKETYNSEYAKISKDKKITNKESRALLKKVAPSYRVYFIRSNFPTYFWYVVIVIFYFGVFAYMNNGATLGKALHRFKVVDNKTGKKPKLWQMLIRNLFGGNMFVCGTNMVILINILVLLISKIYNPVIYLVNFTGILGYILDVIFIVMYFVKKNSRTLDDLVGRTKVVSVPKKSISNEN